MTVYVDKKYLVLPTSKYAAPKRVFLYEDGVLLFDFVCKIDNLAPDFTAYVDVSPFLFRNVSIEIEPCVEYQPKLTDDFVGDEVYAERFRPKVHFTVKNGWNNDPNGLILRDGVYHMFYQYNPAGAEWSNMHWGHATSSDLMHWEEKDIALFPDEMGTMFSGSAITDENNVSGLGSGALLLFYTAAGGTSVLSKNKRFTQCLAYSTDGGVTFKKYDKNPVVDHIEAANRDPKVVYVEELCRYIMLLYLQNNTYAIMSSFDLLTWSEMQRIELAGDMECPDVFPLYCKGKRYWVIMGAFDKYIVGRFDGGAFVPDTAVKTLTHLKMSYAAQSFSGIDGRVVRISWNITDNPSCSFTSQMGFPTEMTLCECEGELYLACAPIREIERLYESRRTLADVSLDEDIKCDIGQRAVDISLDAQYVAGEKLTVSVFGTEIVCDMEKNEIRCKRAKLPLSVCRDRLRLRLVVDTASIEIYGDGGKAFAAVAALSDYNLPYLKISKNERIKLSLLEICTLKGVHENET